ncbi:hypothetical protein ACTWJ8_39840 (plasmid) [Streptomyces sp. SDT5-1]|uniref:hypothetical protein n=1 Tax=Streptomyces sp. SDT5-1 TaxID=3406418 RepID=UPI003FD042BC
MPIHLTAPASRPVGPDGPDGRSMNRVALNVAGLGLDDQCALLPRNLATLWESQDTRRARWGGFGLCTKGGACSTCPVLTAAPKRLDSPSDEVLIRVDEDGRAHQVHRPEDGWASRVAHWPWPDLARLEGWRLGQRHSDEHSQGFWLLRAASRKEQR